MAVPERIYRRGASGSTQPIDRLAKGRILLRMDPAAIGRITRLDLAKNGYAVTSLPSLNSLGLASQTPDTIIFFHHANEPLPLESLRSLPEGIPVVLAPVGSTAPDPSLVELADRHGYRLLASEHGPNLHRLLQTLQSLPRP